ncbi:hypothetical protein B0J14DRAFT_21991 [Halenospora varia]|nr:hypothetical protein B0J14DRAFT_21991 [Halenospora varia]
MSIQIHLKRLRSIAILMMRQDPTRALGMRVLATMITHQSRTKKEVQHPSISLLRLFVKMILTFHRKSPDVMVVYEGWLLTRTKDQQNPALVSFCGLNIKIYPSAPDDRFSIVGNSLDQDHLSNMLADNRVSTKVTLKIEDLHSDAQQEIQDLLEDRNENSDLEFEWSLEAIIEISSSNTRKKSIFNRKKNTTKENGIVSKWQVILRGGLRKSPPKVEDLVPTRSSPWGRASRRYQRRGSDIIVRRTAFRKSGRYRAAGSSVSSKETPPRRRTKPIKHTGKHVIATQSVNTGRHGDVVVETRTSRRSSDSEPIPIMEMPAATGNQTTTYAETISLDPNETSRKEEREEAERVMDEYLKTFVNDDDT